MRNFAVRSFEANGQLKSEVFGTELRHYPDTDTSEIDAPRIRKVSNLGRTTEGTAGRAVANGDGSEVQLIGNVVIIRGASPMNPENLGTANAATARLEFRGEFIHALIDFETLKSHRPAVLTRGLDRFAADSFIYDQVQGVVELKGRVNGQLTPKDSR